MRVVKGEDINNVPEDEIAAFHSAAMQLLYDAVNGEVGSLPVPPFNLRACFENEGKYYKVDILVDVEIDEMVEDGEGIHIPFTIDFDSLTYYSSKGEYERENALELKFGLSDPHQN